MTNVRQFSCYICIFIIALFGLILFSIYCNLLHLLYTVTIAVTHSIQIFMMCCCNLGFLLQLTIFVKLVLAQTLVVYYKRGILVPHL